MFDSFRRQGDLVGPWKLLYNPEAVGFVYLTFSEPVWHFIVSRLIAYNKAIEATISQRNVGSGTLTLCPFLTEDDPSAGQMLSQGMGIPA